MTRPAPDGPAISIVVPTLGRVAEPARLLDSLRGQLRDGDEVILVDQNPDDRLVPVLAAAADLDPVHVRTAAGGAARARNVGLEHARRDVIWFPDDDGWATDGQLDILRRLVRDEPEVDVFGGRIVDEAGNPSMGRWPAGPVEGTRGNIWRIGAEATLVFRRRFFDRAGRFRESIGVGTPGPWGAGEGQDLLLRGLAAGCRVAYRPQNVFGHPNKFERDTAAVLAKGASYARGIGFVMGANGYTVREVAPHLLKPVAAIAVYALTGRFGRARFYLGQLVNRWAGWRAGRADRARPSAGRPTPSR